MQFTERMACPQRILSECYEQSWKHSSNRNPLNGDFGRFSFDGNVPIATHTGRRVENDDVTLHENVEEVTNRGKIDFFRGSRIRQSIEVATNIVWRDLIQF